MTEALSIKQWYLFVKTLDRPGAAASIAVAFADRGLQIESFIGHGGEQNANGNDQGYIVISFYAFERHMYRIINIIRRMEKVVSAEIKAYKDDYLLKTVTFQCDCISEDITLKDNIKIWFYELEAKPSRVYIVSGKPQFVDQFISTIKRSVDIFNLNYSITMLEIS